MGATFGRAMTAAATTTKPIKADFHFSNIIMLIQGDLRSDLPVIFWPEAKDFPSLSRTSAAIPRIISTSTPLAIFDADGLSALAGLADLTLDPAGSDDLIASLEVFDQILVFLGASLLRPDQQEIENCKNKKKRQQLTQNTWPASPAACA